MNVGELFACQFYRDEPFMLGAGGDAGMLAIWDSDEQQVIKNYFAERVQLKPSEYLGVQQQEVNHDNSVHMTDGFSGANNNFLDGLSSLELKQRNEAEAMEQLLANELAGSVATSSSIATRKDKKKKKKKVNKTNA
jgi:hypothetical protein